MIGITRTAKRAAVAAATLASAWLFGASSPGFSTPDSESTLGLGESEALAAEHGCAHFCATKEKKCADACKDKVKECASGCPVQKDADQAMGPCLKKCQAAVPKCAMPCIEARARCQKSC